MEKMKNDENFKEYAQRWRNIASQVQPPMMQSEMCSYFVRSLPNSYYEIMLGTHIKEFEDLFKVGERV